MIKEFTISNKNTTKYTFVDKEFGNIRVIVHNYEVFFCAKDVCYAFGMRDYKRYVSQYCRYIHHFYHDTNGGIQRLNFIDFEDVLHLYEHAKIENAVELRKKLGIMMIAMMRVHNGFVDSTEIKHKFSFMEGIFEDVTDASFCPDCEYRVVCDCDGDCDNCDDLADCDGDCTNCTEFYKCDVPKNENNELHTTDVGVMLEVLDSFFKAFEKTFKAIVGYEGLYRVAPNGDLIKIE